MNKEFVILFMVRAIELPKDYKEIINKCKSNVITYFGTRNVENTDDSPCLHIKCEIIAEDAEELRNSVPDYVELAFIEKVEDKILVVDL